MLTGYEAMNLNLDNTDLVVLSAQKELKAKYPDPYYWGAFVMVGE